MNYHKKKAKDKKKTVDEKDKGSKFTGTKTYFAEEKDIKLLQLEKAVYGETSKYKTVVPSLELKQTKKT